MTLPMVPSVQEVYDSYSEPLKRLFGEVRNLILAIGRETAVVGPLSETLRWGQPSFLTEETGSGTTIRVDRFDNDALAVFVNCQTTLISDARTYFPELTFSKNRAIVLGVNEEVPYAQLSAFLELALTYKARKGK